MKYWENSLLYKALAGSWFFGWLLLSPEDKSGYFYNAWTYRFVDKMLVAVLRALQQGGQLLQKKEIRSELIKNPAAFLAVCIFFYLSFDLIFHDYLLTRNMIEVLIIILAFLMSIYKSLPGIWQGSFIYRFFDWWTKTD